MLYITVLAIIYAGLTLVEKISEKEKLQEIEELEKTDCAYEY